MDINLPVWGYYPQDNSQFIDPLYIPYQNQARPSCHARKVRTPNGKEVPGECPYNPWREAGQGYSDGLVHPELVRKGWGQDFMLLHPDKDPCPEGWTKTKGGWCVANKPEFGDHGLYSTDAFIPEYQYHGGYAPARQCPRDRPINEFDNRSVNPFTGDYVRYFPGTTPKNRSRYGALPSKDSLLA
jgi:hypothetical protein